MILLFRILGVLPLWLAHAVGTLLGWVAFLGSPTYRRRFLDNARAAGLGLAQVRAAVGAAGRMVGEAPRLWFGAPVAVEWIGTDLIDQARAQGRGLLFLTPHLGCFEVCAKDFARRFGPITVLYRPPRKVRLRPLMEQARSGPNLQAAPTTLAGVKQLLRALQAGEAVGLLPDQVPPQGMGVWAPFFGREAYTMTLSARLARQTGALVVLAWGERLSWGRGYKVHLTPCPPLPADPQAAATAVNAHMEALVRQCPGQYMWGYARYKAPRQERQP